MEKKMKVYLVRHGQTTGDVEDKYGGNYDDHLTDKGKLQSKELADKLKDKSIEIIYHSPKLRATETAKIVSNNLNIKTKVIRDLRERNNYGVLTGLTRSEAKKRFPDQVRELKNGLYHRVRDSENYLKF
ncbi:MAG: histidine phosphatase family protein, partial [Nanoarchaeota archaeon]